MKGFHLVSIQLYVKQQPVTSSEDLPSSRLQANLPKPCLARLTSLFYLTCNLKAFGNVPRRV